MPDSSAELDERQEHCAICGAAIPPAAPGGQCPLCLLNLASSTVLEEEAAAWRDLLLGPEQVRKFGDYELLEEIARGGMGVVYRAWQASADREVAVKMIVAGQLATPETVARFQNEAAAASRLVHPHIVPVYEFGEYETQHYFSMRFIPGKRNIATWARELPAEQRFPAIAQAMCEVARAVAHAHQQGVLHRDLKPSNVLIDEKDEPQVTDFGLAKLLDADDALALTLSSAILGSPSYMAPEQADPRGRRITAATDVYGLGAILYELLAGRPPFTGASPLIVARQVVEQSPARLFDIPPDLETLCRKCLAKDPQHRYSSAAALADDLDRFSRGQPILAEPESTLSLIAGWSRRHPALSAMAAALAISLGAGFFGVLWQWRHAEAARQEVATANLHLQQANTQLSRTIDHLEWRTLDMLLERDYARRALAELASRLRSNPRSWQAASYAISLVEQRPFARPVGPAVLFTGPKSPINHVTPDGTRFAYLAGPRQIRMLDAASTADCFPSLETPTDIGYFKISPDGTLLAAGTVDGKLRFWQLPEGRLVAEANTPITGLLNLNFSADGHTLFCHSREALAAGRTADFLVGNAPTRTFVPPFPLASVECSADGQRFLGRGEKPGPVYYWGPPGSGENFSLPENAINAALDSGGRRAAIQTNSLEIQVWDLIERRHVSTISGTSDEPLRFNRLAITPDGERVIAGLRIGEARIFSASTGLPTGKAMPFLYETTAVTLDRTGTVIATGARDFCARLWNAATGEPLGEPIPHSGPVRTVDLSADARHVLTASDVGADGTYALQLWHQAAPVRPATYEHEGRDFDGTRLSPDGRYLVFASELPKPMFSVVELSTGRRLFDRVVGPAQFYTTEFSPDSRAVYLATNRGTVFGYSLPGAKPLWPQLQLPAGNQPSTLSPDGRWLAVGGTDGVLRFIDTSTGQVGRECVHGALIKCISFTKDNHRVTCGGEDGLATVWDTESGNEITKLQGHGGVIVSIQFSPDGTRILTASYDFTARLWDAATGQPLGRPMPHNGELSQAEFSPDGRRVATAARDGTARIWDGHTGAPLTDPISRPATVNTVRFHPDGRRLLTHDFTGFRLWDVETGEAVTLQYPSPLAGGLGLDHPAGRGQFSSDGKAVVFGHSQWQASIWPISDPPVPVPTWFPDFLDVLATPPGSPDHEASGLPAAKLLEFQNRARTFGDADFYEAWLRRFYELKGK